MINFEIIGNELVLYEIKLRKNRLKAIRKKLIAKFGEPEINLGNNVENKITKDEIRSYNFLDTFYSFKRKENKDLYVPIGHPELALYITECLNGSTSFQFISYLHANYKLKGIEYLPQILDCIELTEIYRDTFYNSEELIEKLLASVPQNSDLFSQLFELKKYALGSSFSVLKKQEHIKKKVRY